MYYVNLSVQESLAKSNGIGLLIRRSLVRAQVGEPIKSMTYEACKALLVTVFWYV